MVLGTALTALSPECLAAPATEASPRAIVDMSRYCTTCWRNARLPADSWGDCTQEVFHRMLERVPTTEWDLVLRDEGEERREFLRAIDAVKKRTQRARRHAPAVEAVADGRDSAERQLAEDREAVRQAACELLTPRQQKILQLSFEGWAAHDIASELAMPVERVSDEKYKAVRKLRAHLADQEEG
jgi:RNA polymerase sigma factor (sigma-70 family)